MKGNQLITIAGQDFILTKSAAEITTNYLSKIRKKYRFRPNAKKSLEEALRDVLISYQTKSSKVITKPKATKATAIVGDNYEEIHPLGRLLKRLKGKAMPIFERLKLLAKDQRTRTFSLILAACLFTAIGVNLLIPVLRNNQPDPSESTESYSITTVIGDVRSSHWAEYPEFPPPPSGTEQAIAGAITCLLAAILLLMLARRQKLYLPMLLLVLASGVAWSSITYATNQDKRIHQQRLGTMPVPGTETVRTTEDLDYLSACGTEINYVMGAQSGRLFYDFQDQGFELAKELQREGTYGYPDRATICSAYDELRRSRPDDHIVLQMFIRDNQGTIRPFDYQEKYISNEGGHLSRYPMRYGFFVKDI